MVPHLGHTNPVVVVTAHVYMSVFAKTQREKCENSNRLVCKRIYLRAINVGLTSAGLRALQPAVINAFVTNTSAVFKPSTASSATTLSAGFLERATLGTHHRISDR